MPLRLECSVERLLIKLREPTAEIRMAYCGDGLKKAENSVRLSSKMVMQFRIFSKHNCCGINDRL